MIRDYGDSVEADFADAGINLSDLFRPGTDMTVRRAWVLVRGLPLHARLWGAADAELKQAAIEADRQRHLDAAARYAH